MPVDDRLAGLTLKFAGDREDGLSAAVIVGRVAGVVENEGSAMRYYIEEPAGADLRDVLAKLVGRKVRITIDRVG